MCGWVQQARLKWEVWRVLENITELYAYPSRLRVPADSHGKSMQEVTEMWVLQRYPKNRRRKLVPPVKHLEDRKPRFNIS